MPFQGDAVTRGNQLYSYNENNLSEFIIKLHQNVQTIKYVFFFNIALGFSVLSSRNNFYSTKTNRQKQRKSQKNMTGHLLNNAVIFLCAFPEDCLPCL